MSLNALSLYPLCPLWRWRFPAPFNRSGCKSPAGATVDKVGQMEAFVCCWCQIVSNTNFLLAALCRQGIKNYFLWSLAPNQSSFGPTKPSDWLFGSFWNKEQLILLCPFQGRLNTWKSVRTSGTDQPLKSVETQPQLLFIYFLGSVNSETLL